MPEHEFYREKTIIHHDAAHPGHDHVVEREYESDGSAHVAYDHRERRQDFRMRGTVRSEILSFRRGVFLILHVVEALLAIEFILQLFGAALFGPFAAFMSAITYPLIAPFGSFGTLLAPGLIINWSILIALVAYGLLAYLLVALFESGIRAAYRR